MKSKEYFESYSNLAYSLAGIAAYLLPSQLTQEYKLLFCMAMQALSAASFTYHYYKTKPIFLFDWWAMMFVVSIIFGITIGQQWAWIAAIIWNIIYPYLLMGKRNVFLEVGFSVAPTLLAIFLIKDLSTSFIVTLIFVVAVIVRAQDEDPTQAKFHDSWEHSVWHILTAIGFYLAVIL